MKGPSDDAPTGSQTKSPSPERQWTTAAYADEVKETLKDQIDKYDMYVALMKDFEDKRIDTAGVLAQVKDIFKGHKNLIRGFNTFKLNEDKTNLDEDGATPSVFNQGCEFGEKIKERLGMVDEYLEFLKYVQDYHKDNINATDLQIFVTCLLGDNHDLVGVFNQNMENGNIDEFLLGVMSKERKVTIEDSPTCWQYKEPLRPRMEDEANAYVKKVKETFQDEKEKRDMFFVVMHEYHAKRIGPAVLITRVKELMKGHTDLLHGLNTFLPAGYEIILEEDAQRFGVVLFEKVKERLDSVDEYHKFLQFLFDQGKKVSPLDTIKKQNLQDAVTSILGAHADLMDEFNQLLDYDDIDKVLALIEEI